MQMVDGGPQRPGESDRDYIRRLGEYSRQQEAEKKRKRRGDPRAQQDANIQDNIEADFELNQMVREATGMSLDDAQKLLDQSIAKTGADWDARDQQVLAEWKNARKRRVFESKAARNRRVAKFTKKNKNQIKRIEKKSNGGCAVVAVMLLGAAGGAGWAVYEAGSAIVSALGH